MPSPPETTFVTANGIRQNVATAGDPAAPAVLLVHGLGWDHTLWARQVERLAAGGWRAVAPDLRGMGATDKPDAPYTIDLYAADLIALLDALGIGRTAIVGFSLGGMIALALAARHPARFAAAVFACCTPNATREGEAGTEAMLARAETLGARSFAAEQAEAIWSPAYAARHPDAVARFVAWRAAMDQAALARAFRAATGVDLRPELGRIAMPSRVIVADGDRFLTVATGRALAEAIPGADFIVVENAGHMASIEQPAAFDGAVLGLLASAWPPVATAASPEAA